MAFTVGSPSADPDVLLDVNTTPLIDVMLVLLVMLIITIPIQTHAVKLDMPRPNPQQPDKPDIVVEITVDFDGSYTWNTNPVTREQLKGYLFNASKEDPQPELHIKPGRNTPYGPVAEAMAIAQHYGLIKIGITGLEQFPEYLGQ